MATQSKRPNRWFLATLLAVGGIGLLLLTVRATLVRSVFDNADLMNDVWFQVALFDAYLGFLIFYGWIALRESSMAIRIIWFVLMMCFGNMAACGYRFPNGNSTRTTVRLLAPTESKR